MPRSMRMRMKLVGVLAPAGVLAAVAAIALPATSQATPTGSQTVTANVNLDCVLAPGTLNVEATIGATLTGTAPVSVSPGDPVTLTNVTTSLSVPAALSSSFAALGATSASGSVTSFVLDVTNGSNTSVNAASPALPFGPVNVVAGQALTLPIPNTGPFTLALGTATGAVGSNAVLSIDSTPGWTGDSTNGFTATGKGVMSTVTGATSSGGRVGPLAIDCNAPSGVTLGSVAIVAATSSSSSSSTSSTTSSSTSSTTSSTHTTSTTTTTSSSTSTSDEVIPFSNWTLSGSVTAKKLGQKISLPSGATFNGSADLTKDTLTGNISIPKFNASVKILGIPTTVGLTFSESGPATGTITPSGSNLVIAATAKANIGITAVGILGLNIPTSCTTSTPVVFPLSATEPSLALLSGATFTGTTTFPSIKCGGLLGGLLSPVLTALFSGPSNPFSLTIAPASSAS